MQSKPSLLAPGPNGQDDTARPAAVATVADAAVTDVSEVHNFLADLEDLIKATTSLTGEDLARAKAQFMVRVSAARASIARVGGAIADRTRQTARATNTYVHERPWQAVGIGAAAGLLAGVLLARRRR